jgi:hypothetical protein
MVNTQSITPRRSPSPPVLTTCQTCGTEFIVHACRRSRKKYCSMKCRLAHWVDPQEFLFRNREIGPKSECWLWTGPCQPNGYGQATVNGICYSAHRLSAHLYLGMPLNSPMLVCHKCDTPRCFNPAHLFLGTYADNSRDMSSKGRNLKGDDHPAHLHPERQPRGEAHHHSVLTADKVRKIRCLRSEGIRGVDVAKQFGISPGHVDSISKRRTWKHIP